MPPGVTAALRCQIRPPSAPHTRGVTFGACTCAATQSIYWDLAAPPGFVLACRIFKHCSFIRTVVPVVRHTAQESLILLTRATACQAIAPGSSAADAQQWWVQSLEAWRVAMGLLRFELCGASFTRNVMHMH